MPNFFLSPNSTFKDNLTCLSYLFLPWKWLSLRQGKYINKLENWFKNYFKIKHAFSFDSGRSSLYVLIKALGVTEGDEVLLQAYTCIVVPNAIIFNGAKPVYVDIEPDTFNLNPVDLEKKITKKSKAIIIQNTFGQPADYEKIIKIAQKHNLKIIEDCAHSLGSEINGQKVGTLGDAAMFSFGRDKVISCVYGGMAITNDDALAEKIKQIKNQLAFPDRRTVFQHLMHPLIFALALPFYHLANFGKLIIIIAQKLHLVSKAIIPMEKKSQKPFFHPAKLPNALAQIAMNQLKFLNCFNDHRLALAELYFSALKDTSFKLPEFNKNEKNIFLRFTVRSQNRDYIMRKMKQQGIYLGDWYNTVLAPKDADPELFGYHQGSCPNAELAAPETINLPTSYKVKITDAKKIIVLLNELGAK